MKGVYLLGWPEWRMLLLFFFLCWLCCFFLDCFFFFHRVGCSDDGSCSSGSLHRSARYSTIIDSQSTRHSPTVHLDHNSLEQKVSTKTYPMHS